MISGEPQDPVFGASFRAWMITAAILFATVLSLLPVLFGIPAPGHQRNLVLSYGAIYCPAIAAVLLCYFCNRRMDRQEKLDALLLCSVLALLTNYLHLWLVDNASYVSGPNLTLQTKLHESVLALAPEALPHSYRFLPNSIIRLLELITGDFATARDSYRNLFGVLTLYAFYHFARLFLKHGGALFCLLFWTAVSPVSFRYYGGQAADPISHLSFLLSFIFLETDQFLYLLLAILIGALAKETILAMGGYYVIFSWKDKRFFLRASVLLCLIPILFFGVRALVLHHTPGLTQISGVDLSHVSTNLRNYLQWSRPILYTVGIFVPFVVLGWRVIPWRLRSLALYLFPVLFVSSLFFSWLREARNFMPLVAILVVMTVYYLLPQERGPTRPQAT